MTSNINHEWNQLFSNQTCSLQLILQFLPFHQCFLLRSVCQQFNNLIVNQHNNSIAHFSLPCNAMYMKSFHIYAMRDLAKYASSSLQSFRVEMIDFVQQHFGLVNPQVLTEICHTFTNIQVLSLPMCARIGYNPNSPNAFPLAQIRRLPKLHTLDISGCNVTDQIMISVGQCRSLTELNISINKWLTDAGIKALFTENLLLRQLTALDVSYTSISDEMFKYCYKEEIGALHNLKQIHVMHTQITEAGLELFFFNQQKFLAEKASERVQELKIERINLLNVKSLKNLQFLSGRSKVEKANSKNKQPTVTFQKLWKLSALHGLCLNWSSSLNAEKELNRIGELGNLKELILIDINKWHASYSQALSRLVNLDTLSFRCERLDRTVTKDNAQNQAISIIVNSFPKLKKVDIHCKFEDFIQQQYLKIFSNAQNLEYLHLDSQQISANKNLSSVELENLFDEQLGALIQSDSMKKNLKHLTLSIPSYSIGSTGFAHLCQLRSLEELNVRLNNSILPETISDSTPRLSNTLQILHMDQYCTEPSLQLSPGTISIVLKPLNNLRRLMIENQQFVPLGELTERHSSNFLETIGDSCKQLYELRIDLNSFKCLSENLDNNLLKLGDLTELRVLSLTNNEEKWSKIKTVFPLSKKLKQLVHLCLPKSMVVGSQSTWEKLYPATVVFHPESSSANDQ